MKYTHLILIFLAPILLFGQSNNIRKIDSTKYAKYLDFYYENYGRNKDIPKEYELQILIALSYYPELSDTHIQFKTSKIKTTLNARPSSKSLLLKKKDSRSYTVRINNSHRDSTITLNKVPFNAQIGLFGHEFAHFIDYSNLNTFGVLGRGLSYLTKKSKTKFEFEIDLATIHRGLGWQLYDWASFVLFKSDATEKYKQFKRDVYMQPEEILIYMLEK